MAIKRPVPGPRIQFRGVWSMEQLLKFYQKWFTAEYYNFFEKVHKYKPDEQEVELFANRKYNEYVRFNMYVEIHTYHTEKAEIIMKGKKIPALNGVMRIEIRGEVELDWQNRFGGNKFLKRMQELYHTYIIKQTIEQIWDDHMEGKVAELGNATREQLGMEA